MRSNTHVVNIRQLVVLLEQKLEIKIIDYTGKSASRKQVILNDYNNTFFEKSVQVSQKNKR